MKKFIILTVILQSAAANLFSQATRTTVLSGNWLSPATWDCTCIPMPWDNIIVNHNVNLDTSWYSTAAVTVNLNGSITEGSSLRQWAVTSGSFTNNGFVNISRLSVTGGAFTNNDSLRVDLAFYVSSVFTNNGKIFDTDSFSNDGIFKNNSSATINCTLYSNLDSIVNDGIIAAYAHTNLAKSHNNGQLNFTDFTNAGTFVNKAAVSVDNFTNTSQGYTTNKSNFSGTNDFLNVGKFLNEVTGVITVFSDFANADSSSGFAHFMNDGFFQAGDNWLNIDSVSGSGTFCVNDSTANTGFMSGTFDFCDNTPPSSPPYIDWNAGTISPAITYCTKSCNSGLSAVAEFAGLFVFPNPCRNFLKIESKLQLLNPEATIYNLFGQLVYRSKIDYANPEIFFDLTGGIYFLIIKSDNTSLTEKIIINN